MAKVRDNQVVQSKPAYLAVGIDADGEKHVLGIWLARTVPETATAREGAPREARARPSGDLVIPRMPAVPTSGGGERPVPWVGQSRMVASMVWWRDWLMFSDLTPCPMQPFLPAIMNDLSAPPGQPRGLLPRCGRRCPGVAPV
jgi:hypothetical protein